MSQQDKSTLQSAINTQLADNTSGDISAADVRDNLINMTDSLLFNSGSQGITGSLAVGVALSTSGNYSVAVGTGSLASGFGSFAHGRFTTASGFYSHAQGNLTSATSLNAHAEGQNTVASGASSHAEGQNTLASNTGAHSEGNATTASGTFSHSEGFSTVALGNYSHTEGIGTIASGSFQHVQGQYNRATTDDAAFILGNGTDNNNRSNLIFAAGNTVQITGSLNVNGSITGSLLGTASLSEATIGAGDPILYPGGGEVQFKGGTGPGSPNGKNTYSPDFLFSNFGPGLMVGDNTTSYISGKWTLATGYDSVALGDYSVSHGSSSYANGEGSFTHGKAVTANGDYSHAEGLNNTSTGNTASFAVLATNLEIFFIITA